MTEYSREWRKKNPLANRNNQKKHYKKNVLKRKSIGALQAKWKVQNAVRRGELPNLKKMYYQCSYCNSMATEYDHRDYSKPLDVKPVCHKCNVSKLRKELSNATS